MDNIRKPVFMTDSAIDSLGEYFLNNESISYETLKNDFKLTPSQIHSMCLSNFISSEGAGKTLRYYPGLLWDTTGSSYRYGSKQEPLSLMKSFKKLAFRTRHDYERGFLFRKGDIVSKSWGNAPTGLGVVVKVLPAQRKVDVRWPYGTYQEHVDELTLIPRDNGDRQMSIPTIDKDIMGTSPTKFEPALYTEHREKSDSYDSMWKNQMTSNLKKKSKIVASLLGDFSMSRVANTIFDGAPLEKFNNQDYILTQSEIIVSVNTEKGNPLYKDTPWYITPETAKNVNDNGDAWTTPVLANSYHTFRGAYNFYEHDQVIENSKGRVLDAILRKVPLGNGKYYHAVEILVATNKKHRKMASRIENGDLRTLSMGCSCTFTQCSQCGHISYSPEQKCAHLKYNKGGTFVDQTGVTRVVAELCGSEYHPDSVEFEEASYVEIPAWRKAEVHNIIASSTNMVNVVGYLNARLYNKDSFEILLSDGKLDKVSIRLKKTAADEFGEFGDEEDGEDEVVEQSARELPLELDPIYDKNYVKKQQEKLEENKEFMTKEEIEALEDDYQLPSSIMEDSMGRW